MLSFLNNYQLSTEQLQLTLKQFEQRNQVIQKKLIEIQNKIDTLPVELKNQIKNQKKFINNHNYKSKINNKANDQDQQQQMIEKRIHFQQKLKLLQQQQNQIVYLNQINQYYLKSKQNLQNDQQNQQNKIKQLNEIQLLNIFLSNLKPYSIESTQPVDKIIQKIKSQNTKKLIQKCQNLIIHGQDQSNKLIIYKQMIKKNKLIILNQNNQNKLKIISTYINKILHQIFTYDVRYQKVLLLQIVDNKNSQPSIQNKQNKQKCIIHRNRVYFSQQQSSKHYKKIKYTLQKHLQIITSLKSILFSNQQNKESNPQLLQQFDKQVDKQTGSIKGNLQYILPYIDLKCRKTLIDIFLRGQNHILQFQDLILRLKFKGQDGEMFMNNLQAVFNRLFSIQQVDNQHKHKNIQFYQQNFQTLLNFFQLGIYQAQQTIIQSSTKALNKLKTNLNFTLKINKSKNDSLSANIKKLYNMIFFTVSTLIQKFDQLIDQEQELFQNQSLLEKVNQWSFKLLEIRQNIRKKIFSE